MDDNGQAILEGVVIFKSAALLDGDTVTTSLFSGLFAEALRSGRTPREVVLSLWDSLPSDGEWIEDGVREKFEQAVDELEERGL